MDIKKIKCAYFSPTGNVEKVVKMIAGELADCLAVRCEDRPEIFEYDFLLPSAREKEIECRDEEVLIIGVPVFAGRVPNKILPYIQSGFRTSSVDEFNGNERRSLCLPVVCFGNRDCGDALSELAMEMDNAGFLIVGGAAVATEHSFCPEIGTGRPDETDIEAIKKFAGDIAKKIKGQRTIENVNCLNRIQGNMPPGPYYTPLKEDGEPAVFLKAKPITDMMKCDGCMRCAERCPMGSISKDNPEEAPGICIKCQACIKVCPNGAKCFDNPDFISHKNALGSNFKRRAESIFVL